MNDKNLKKVLSVLMSFALVISVLGGFLINAFADSEVYTSTDGNYLYQLLSDGTVSISSGTNNKAYLGSDTQVAVPSEIDGYSVSRIGLRAFRNCNAITSITLPEGIVNIDNYAFEGCSALNTVQLPSTVQAISYGSFLNCSALSSIDFPDGLSPFGTAAFKGCSSLTEIEVPSGVTSIGNLVFANCTSLEAVTIPSSVTSIHAAAFDGCTSLTTIYGYNGTYAQNFAEANSLDFVDLDSLFANVIYSNVESAVAGEEVTVPIMIRNNHGFAGFEIILGYNAEILTPVELIGSDDVLSGNSVNDSIGAIDDSKVHAVWYDFENCTGNGELFSVKFRVNGDAVGTTAIELSYNPINTVDEDLQPVEFNCENVELQISNPSIGLPKITLASENVIAGQSAQLVGSVSGLKSTKNISLTLNYNKDVFDFVSVEPADGVRISNITKTDATVTFTLTSLTTAFNDKDVFTVNFNTNDKAAKGNYDFSGSSVGVRVESVSVTVLASGTSESADLECADVVATRGQSTVRVPVSISNNKGLMGYKLNFSYDADILEPVAVTGSFGGRLFNNIGLNEGSFDVLWNDSEDTADDGEMLVIEFNVVSNTFSTTQIDVSYSQPDTFNEDYENVELVCNGSNVAVNALKGDVDLNGTVSDADYTLYGEYIASTEDFNNIQNLIGDIDGDGVVDAFDMFYLDRIING